MHRKLIFIVAASGLFFYSIAGTTVTVAFPVLMDDLDTTLVVAGWVLSVFQLVCVCGMPIVARLSDSYGRKFTFMVCLVLFTVGSALCAIAPNIGWLIAARVLQGLGGGGFLPAASGIVAETFPKSRQSAIGLFSSVFPIGSVFGPVIGGFILGSLSWHWIFWMNVPIGILQLIAAWYLIPKDPPQTRVSLDLTGGALAITCLASLMIALSLADPKTHVPWVLVGAFAMVFAVSGIIFVRWEHRVKDPLIDLRLLVKRPFREANLYQMVFGACAFGVFTLIPLYAFSVYGMDVFTSGIVLTPRSIGQIIASTIVSFMLVRWGYRKPILCGTIAVAVSLLIMAFESPGFNLVGYQVTPFDLLMFTMFLGGLGVGVAAPAANNACIEMMPEKVAMIAGLRGMFRQLGGALSITIITLVLESYSNLAQGFVVVMIATGIMCFLVIPAIYIMPASPKVKPALN